MLLLPLAGAVGCGSGLLEQGISVATLPTEDLKGPCRYSLVDADLAEIPAGARAGTVPAGGPVAGVLVIFERGDTDQLMEDASVQATALSLHYAILWARECDARSTGDLQADASKGPARTLKAALAVFAGKTGHPELATAPLVLFGFSAAGVLSATMETVWPDQLAGVVMYAAGSGYTDLDDVGVTEASAAIPTLLLANAEDEKSGTARSDRFFKRGEAAGATWGFGVQNKTDHCCSLSTRSIFLPWLQAIARGGNAAATPVSFLTKLDGTTDAQGEVDEEFTTAEVGAGTKGQQTGWMPDAATATAWLAWVTNPETNADEKATTGGARSGGR